MNRWEYWMQQLPVDAGDRHGEMLEKMGQDHWELVSVVPIRSGNGLFLAYYFKRPKKE